MALLMEMWTRGFCRTVNMTCWSLPRSTSDRTPKGKGETKGENPHKHTGTHKPHKETILNSAVGHELFH